MSSLSISSRSSSTVKTFYEGFSSSSIKKQSSLKIKSKKLEKSVSVSANQIYHFISFTQLPVKKLYETEKRQSISSYWKIIQKNAKRQYLTWRLPNTNNFIIRNANIANEKYISFRELDRRKSIIRRTWILHIWRSNLSNRQKVPEGAALGI